MIHKRVRCHINSCSTSNHTTATTLTPDWMKSCDWKGRKKADTDVPCITTHGWSSAGYSFFHPFLSPSADIKVPCNRGLGTVPLGKCKEAETGLTIGTIQWSVDNPTLSEPNKLKVSGQQWFRIKTVHFTLVINDLLGLLCNYHDDFSFPHQQEQSTAWYKNDSRVNDCFCVLRNIPYGYGSAQCSHSGQPGGDWCNHAVNTGIAHPWSGMQLIHKIYQWP